MKAKLHNIFATNTPEDIMEKYYCELHSFLDGDENCPDCKSGRVELPVKPEIASRYFLDTEFIEYPNTIDLISIGIVCEDGRKYYAISSEFDEAKANDWVLKNVIYKLESLPRKSIGQIKQELLEFITGDNIEFWGYYSDYDWTVFSWIFGRMIDLPKGFPMFCYDLRQWLNHKGLSHIKQPDDAPHNALSDAEWVCETYLKYENYKL